MKGPSFGIHAMARGRALFGALLALLLLAGGAQAQDEEDEGDASPAQAFDVQAHYTRQEARIPMRDGVTLFTVIYAPKATSKPHPIIMERTPYSVPYGKAEFPRTLGPSARFARAGYIVVFQDVRGKCMSEGQFVNMRPHKLKMSPKEIDETTDTYDTVEWLVKHVPNNNGRVGLWGISYPGFYAAMGGVNSHPALKAISPQAPCTDWFVGDDDNHNGAFFLMDNFDFAPFDRLRAGLTRQSFNGNVNYNSNDAYQFFLDLGPLHNTNDKFFHGEIPFWNEMLQHDTYDAFWKARNPLTHMEHVRTASLTVGGWYDAEDLYGALHMFAAIAQYNPKTPDYLVMGPWSHGGWSRGAFDHFGDIPFGSKTGPYYGDHIEFPFFDYYLNGSGSAPKAKAQVFETGTNRWRSFAQWPPTGLQSHSLYFQPDKKLASSPPSAEATPDSDSYESDPAHPVPYSPVKSIRRNSLYMIEDQRFAVARPDVLSFQTEPLSQPMTLAGPLTADLFVSTSGTDADFIVKVIDVYPDDAPDATVNGKTVHFAGYQQMVRAEVMRGKFRNSYEKPEPFVPNRATEVKFGLNDICHTFLKGHRLMVQVQSSWFPLVDRNPQTFCDIPTAPESAFQKATIHVYHSARYPSHLTFGVLLP